MKKSGLLLVIFYLLISISNVTITGCSHYNEIVPEQDIPEQYLEEIHTSAKEDEEIQLELMELQQLEVEEYLIGKGDRFHVDIYGEADLEIVDGLVKPDGTLSLKLVGEVKLEGISITEAITKIEKEYGRYLHKPKVSLIPYVLGSSEVTVYGKVERPGTYEITGEMRVLDAIAKSGGLATGLQLGSSVELADLEGSYVIRNNNIIPVNFIELIRKGNMLHNIPLINKDIVYISSSVNKEIYVIGEVTTPGHFPFKEEMTILQAISFAIGLKDTANKSAVVVRGGVNHPRIFKVNLKDIFKGKSRDFSLRPNDVIYVPRSGFAEWNSVVNALLPTLQAVQGGWIVKEIINEFDQ